MIFSTSLFFLSAVSASPLARRAIPSGVPSYVVEYAPVVYLDVDEVYFPSDIGAQLPPNTVPEINFTAVTGAPNPLTLDNLSQLNTVPGAGNGINVFLSSVANVAASPNYIFGIKPDAQGKTNNATSCAIIVNDHGSGLVDAFYMYFYAFNYGGTYYGITVDDHIGDWEHTMVRFQDGLPQAVWYSQHSNGEAFDYATTQKYRNTSRPVAYSANGTHANYATPGTHDHTIPDLNLPVGPIEDFTSAGTFWDPTLSAYYYTYTIVTNTSHAAQGVSGTFGAYDGSTPVDWLYYRGAWGDEELPKSDPRQICPFGINALCKYSGGPTGPEDKQLNRTQVCPDNGDLCIVRNILVARDDE